MLKSKKKTLRRTFGALLLALMLMLVFSGAALAADITVSVAVAVSDDSPDDFADLGPYNVTIAEGSTAWDAIETALYANSIAYDYNTDFGSVYITSVNDLSLIGDYSDGWMFAVNMVAPAKGVDSLMLADGDEILLYYCCNYDFTIPGTISGSGQVSDSVLASFSFSAGSLRYFDDADGSVLVLDVPEGTASVKVLKAYDPANNGSVTIYDNYYATYALADAIDISNGAVLGVQVGDNGDTDYAYYNININEVDLDDLMDNIAEDFAGDSDNYWSVLGVAAYDSSLYQARQSYINTAVVAIAGADAKTLARTVAMHIITLKALGYNAADLIDAQGRAVNAYAKLAAAKNVTVEDPAYALLAYLQASGSAFATQIDDRISAIEEMKVSGQSYWGDDYGEYGAFYADTTAVVIAALQLAEERGYTVNVDLDAAAAYLRSQMLNSGAARGTHDDDTSGNANTTAMALIAMSALGEEDDVDRMMGGLLGFRISGNDGFGYNDTTYNEMATQQGFLALIAYDRFARNGFNVFDFSSRGSAQAVATPDAYYTVSFTVRDYEGDNITDDASITVRNSSGTVQSRSSAGVFSLAPGSYSYTVRYDGHVTESGSFTVSGAAKTIRVDLKATGISVKFRLIGDDEHGDSGHGDYFTWRATRSYTVPEDSSAYDLMALALEDADLSYTWSKGYLSAVENPLTGSKLAEFDNGPDSGWLYTVNGRSPSVGMDDYGLDSGDKVIVYYSDDYTEDYDGFDVRDVDPDSGALKKELKKLLAAAEELLDETVEADSAVGLSNGDTWATSADFDKLEAAIESAQKVYDRSNSKAEDHRSAISALQKAMDKFEQACSRAGEAPSRFYDIPADHWAYPYIDHLAARGVIGGYEDGLFYPDLNIKRCDFVLMLARLSGQTLPVYSDRFNDVSGNAYYADAVAWAAAAGIIGGYENGGFQPQELISRQDMAVMLHRYAGYMGVSLPIIHPAVDFTDAAMIRAYALPAVNAMSQAGIISGYGDGSFRPQGYASRAEAAKMMYMLDSYK